MNDNNIVVSTEVSDNIIVQIYFSKPLQTVYIYLSSLWN